MSEDSSGLDDSYDAVFDQNAAHIRTVAIGHLREAERDAAVLVDLPESGPVVADVHDGFPDVQLARNSLERIARDPSRRVFLVLRPGVDLVRPGRPDVEVEWFDRGRHLTSWIAG
jgi:hypothetical protein